MPTIGVAIAIPEPWATQLQDYRFSLGDETAASIPTHITLIPPTRVSEAGLPVVDAHLSAVSERHRSFRIHLRGTGTFRPVSPVVFVTLAQGISHCGALARDVRAEPLDVPLEFPYHPHVTVAHHLDDERLDQAFKELADFECEFDVRDFHLYLHREGDGWVPTRAFTLDA